MITKSPGGIYSDAHWALLYNLTTGTKLVHGMNYVEVVVNGFTLLLLAKIQLMITKDYADYYNCPPYWTLLYPTSSKKPTMVNKGTCIEITFNGHTLLLTGVVYDK